MFEESSWETSKADDALVKTLFQEYPKIKKKKKKPHKENVPLDTDKVSPQEKSPVSKKKSSKSKAKHLTMTPDEGIKQMETDSNQSSNKIKKKQPKVHKSNNVERKFKAASRETVSVKKKESKNSKLVNDNRKLKSAPKETVTVKNKETKNSKLKQVRSAGVIQAKVQTSKGKGKSKNKYKALAGDVKDVGLDVKAVNPVVDIPKKLKHAGIKMKTLSQEQVKAAISEAANDKMKVKPRKRKQSNRNREDISEVNIESTASPPKKKKKKIQKHSNNSSLDSTEKDENTADNKALKDNLNSSVTSNKKKNPHKPSLKGSQNSDNTTKSKIKEHSGSKLLSKKKKKSSKLSSTGDLSTNKSGLSVDKLKSLLSQDNETPDDAYRQAQVTEGSTNVKTKRKESKKQEIKKSLKETLENRLMSSQFRYLNEKLYTCTGEEALQMFAEDEEAFHCYHMGFQAQVEKWPSNPVDRAIDYLKARSAALVVADFGCGEAKIAQSVKNQVHSFDLVKVNEFVTLCDISKVPLKDSSIDVAVFCLSLMGTNFTDFICEASRVLKTGGTLLIAEVTSRFDRPTRFARKVEKLGFSLENQDQSNKMFIWFEFKKTGKIPSEERIPKLDLAPCYYKRR